MSTVVGVTLAKVAFAWTGGPKTLPPNSEIQRSHAPVGPGVHVQGGLVPQPWIAAYAVAVRVNSPAEGAVSSRQCPGGWPAIKAGEHAVDAQPSGSVAERKIKPFQTAAS